MRTSWFCGSVLPCVLTASTTVYAQQAPAPPPEVRIQNVHNRVEVALRTPGGSHEAPRGARDNEVLAPGTRITTHADSEAVLPYGPLGELQIDEQTEIVLFGAAGAQPAGSPPVRDTSVVRGAVRVIVNNPGPANAISVHTPGGVVQMTRGEFRVHVDSSRATRVVAYSGRARVSDGPRAFLVGAGTATRIDVGNRGAPAFPPVPVPRAPVWSQPFPARIVAVGGMADVEARYAPPPTQRHPVHQWVQELARDERFDDVVFERTVEAGETRIHAERLPQGVYFARVIIVDAERFEGLSSPTARFEIVAPRVIPGGPGRRAEVLVPQGLFCRLDGNIPVEAGAPFALLPARTHELSCSASADMSAAVNLQIPADQAGDLAHEVSLLADGWTPTAGSTTMVIRLRDASGRPYSYATIDVTGPRGVTVDPVREEAERGAYSAEVHWPANTPFALEFTVNRALRFTERFGPGGVVAGTAVRR